MPVQTSTRPPLVVDAGGDALPGACEHFSVADIEPAAAESAGECVADHAGDGHFGVGAKTVDDLAPHAAAVLVAAQGLQVAAVDGEHGGPVGVAVGKVGQRFGVAEGGKTVAAAPVEGGLAVVPEKAVLLLDVGVQEEAGEDVEVGVVAGELESAAEYGAGEEHVFDLVTGVGRDGNAVVMGGAVAVGGLHEKVGVAAVAGGSGEFIGPDEAGEVGAAFAAGGEPLLVRRTCRARPWLRCRGRDRAFRRPIGPGAGVR